MRQAWIVPCYLVTFLSVLSGCGPSLLPYPKWESRPKVEYPVPKQINSPCDNLKKEPPSVPLGHNGHIGVWISKNRASCILARAKIGRECRKNCLDLLSRSDTATNHYVETVKTAYKNIIEQDRHAHKAYVRKIFVVGSIAIVVAVAIGVVIGKTIHSVSVVTVGTNQQKIEASINPWK